MNYYVQRDIGFHKFKGSVLILDLHLQVLGYFSEYNFEEYLGVRAPNKAKLYCCVSPVGPYFPSGFKAIRVLCNTLHVFKFINLQIRAYHGGVGEYKVGGNYAPTIRPNLMSEKKGFT